MTKPCLFCNPRPERIIAETPLTITTHDNYPVSPGHTLIMPKRHMPSLF